MRHFAFHRAAIFGVVVATASGALAQSKYLDAPASGIGRVSNFYKVVTETDSPACREVLLSLNKEYSITQAQLDANPRAAVSSDTLLQSDLQVPWVRKLVQEPDADFRGTTSLDVAQVRVDGHAITLFRRAVERRDNELAATFDVNRLWMSAAPPPPLPVDRYLKKVDLASVIHGDEIVVDLTSQPNIEVSPNLAKPGTGQASAEAVLLNVASVKSGLYLLAVDVIEAELSAPRSNHGFVDLYVLRLRAENDIRAVSHFRST